MKRLGQFPATRVQLPWSLFNNADWHGYDSDRWLLQSLSLLKHFGGTLRPPRCWFTYYPFAKNVRLGIGKGEKEYREISQSWGCSMKNVQLSSNVATKLDKHCSLASWVYGPSNTWHYKISQNANWRGMDGGRGEQGQSTSLSGSDTSPNLYFTFSLFSIRYNETIVNPNHFRPRSGSWKDPISPPYS